MSIVRQYERKFMPNVLFHLHTIGVSLIIIDSRFIQSDISNGFEILFWAPNAYGKKPDSTLLAEDVLLVISPIPEFIIKFVELVFVPELILVVFSKLFSLSKGLAMTKVKRNIFKSSKDITLFII